MWNLENGKDELVCRAATETQMLRKNVWTPKGKVVGGGGCGVMYWEIGIDIYTLMCIKWMANKKNKYRINIFK